MCDCAHLYVCVTTPTLVALHPADEALLEEEVSQQPESKRSVSDHVIVTC